MQALYSIGLVKMSYIMHLSMVKIFFLLLRIPLMAMLLRKLVHFMQTIPTYIRVSITKYTAIQNTPVQLANN